MRLFRRYWGYLALIAAIVGLVTHELASAVILALSLAAVAYFAFQAPVWCGAITRSGQLCRNNSTGLLLGCHNRQHKWQKLKMVFIPRAWRELNKGLWAGPSERTATVASLAGVVSALAAAVPLIFK